MTADRVFGLTVRWSLSDSPSGTAAALRDYVTNQSLARFSGMAGLHQKIWSLSTPATVATPDADEPFFAGTYLWASSEARTTFLTSFLASPSAVTTIVGSPPASIEEFDVVAIAEGAAGMAELPG